jgi:uncharacterized protein (TIGR00645 family)
MSETSQPSGNKSTASATLKSQRRLAGNFQGVIERGLFGARWLLAPLYLGLAFSLIGLCVKFIENFIEMVQTLTTSDLHSVTLDVLELLDITLLCNLIDIIIFSGNENFVSKIGIAEDSVDRPAWMGKVDYSGLKIKLIGSLVAISVIELLKDFMNPEKLSTETEQWRIGIHLTFVISGVLFAFMDYIADKRVAFELDAERKDLELEKLRHEINEFKHEHRHARPNHDSLEQDSSL